MNNERLRFYVTSTILMVVWMIVLQRVMPQFLGPQRPPSQAQIQQQIQKARDKAAKAEQDALTGSNRLSIGDRSKKWDEAIQAYREIERLGDRTDVAIDAKFQQARLHEARAATDARDTSDYDQAEAIYKDLERKHAHDSATITVNGQPTRVAVGQLAREKLEADLIARDLRLRHDLRYRILDFFVGLTGRIPGFSYWFALVLITLLIKAILFPFTKKQFKSMADMQRIAPKMKEVQEKLKGRPADEINRKIMALYKEEGVNPAAGCVPMVAQMAVLIPLYAMIRMYEYQFRHGYFLWIGSALSQKYPQFLATSLAVPDVPLLLLYLVSMFLTSKLQPPAADPQQAQTQKMMAYMMPVVFGVMTWQYAWPSAFTFYWLILNAVSTWQQWHILRVVGVPAPAAAAQKPASPADQGGKPQLRGGGSPAKAGPTNGNGRSGSPSIKPGDARRSGSKKSGRR